MKRRSASASVHESGAASPLFIAEPFTKGEAIMDEKGFLAQMRACLGQMAMQEVAIDGSMKKIEAEGGAIDLALLKAEKMEKVTFSTITLKEASVSEASLLAWPEDGNNRPLFWCNLTRMPGMNIFINDFTPMTDLVLYPQYGERYLDDLLSVKSGAAEALKDGMVDKSLTMSTKTVWALSPHCTVFSLADEVMPKLGPVIEEYCKLYVKLWQDAAKIENSEERQFSQRKKAAVRKMMKENDPGYYFMVNIFGQETTTKVFDFIF